MQYAVNISQQSPKYYLDDDDDDYKIFLMRVLPGLEVDVNQSITYSFQVTSVVCKFWRKNQWNSYGCTAKAHSEDDGIHCQCEHISIITGYLDRTDKKFTTVIVLDDNMPGNRYPYLLAVYTSSRLNAGTTAHVGLKLIGTLGSSHIHILTKENAKVLRRNSDDWFLLYCAEPLGLLDSIHIWHDNHGSSPEWYCDKIHVFDLKVGIETIFIVAQWMALNLKYYPEAMYNPTNEEELLGKRQILADNCFLGLREGHIFLAVLLRHPRNPISRVQRLTVLWCCIFSVMLCTLLYYLPEDRLLNTDEFQYTLGTRECYAILLSALVIIIVSNILLACFRRSNEYIHRRHDSLLYLRGGSRYGSRRPSTTSGTTNDTRGGHEMDQSYWTAYLSIKVLGIPQLRQFRVLPIGDEHDKCIPGLTEKYRDTATYEVGWKLAPLARQVDPCCRCRVDSVQHQLGRNQSNHAYCRTRRNWQHPSQSDGSHCGTLLEIQCLDRFSFSLHLLSPL
ncbi:hypothetical protein J6590_097485 [Homalodisca vitripennis]|nr:hypothetical protein J6590_097485 [Homalodisca vitripennis]